MKKNTKISYRKLIILIAIIILLIIIAITLTMARYRSGGNTTANAEIAFYIIEPGYQNKSLTLSDLYPREQPFEYEFTVSNSDGEHISETALEYELTLQITTNLPLQFEVYKNGSKLSGSNIENNIVLDETGQNYIRKIKIKNGDLTFDEEEVDTYRLSVTFPLQYNTQEEFEGMIDHIGVTLDAKQKID